MTYTETSWIHSSAITRNVDNVLAECFPACLFVCPWHSMWCHVGVCCSWPLRNVFASNFSSIYDCWTNRFQILWNQFNVQFSGGLSMYSFRLCGRVQRSTRHWPELVYLELFVAVWHDHPGHLVICAGLISLESWLFIVVCTYVYICIHVRIWTFSN